MWPKNLKSMPSIKAVMTPFPYSIDSLDPLSRAREMMSANQIHHLPVMEAGELVGVLSHPEVEQVLEKVAAGGDSPSEVLVGEAPRREPYTVDLSEPLDRVLTHMAESRVDVALVTKEGRLAGIFTLTDACRCFAESLKEFFPSSGGDEAA